MNGSGRGGHNVFPGELVSVSESTVTTPEVGQREVDDSMDFGKVLTPSGIATCLLLVVGAAAVAGSLRLGFSTDKRKFPENR